MKPVIAIVGRPNVGKSTLFNRLTRSRDALVADFAGLTRDRHYGNGRMGDREFICIDTGGFEPVAKTGILAEMAKQTKQAVVEADIVIFLVDARLGMAPQDRVIADFLRKTGRPVILAVNKAEGMSHATVSAEFYELGLGEPQAISSAHGDGVRAMIDEALDALGIPDEPEEVDKTNQPMRIAVVGRPNVGKSTFINSLIGEERVIAFDMPGTTRDAIEVPFVRGGKPYIMIDTAGLRETADVVEAKGIERSWDAIRLADLVIFLTDAQSGAQQDDLKTQILKELPPKCAVLEVINKADLLQEGLKPAVADALLVSAKTGAGIEQLKLKILELVGWSGPQEGAILARRRHLDCIERAAELERVDLWLYRAINDWRDARDAERSTI